MKLSEAIRYLNSYANIFGNGCGSYMCSAIKTVLAQIEDMNKDICGKTNFCKLKKSNILEAASMLSNSGNRSLEDWIDWLENEKEE